MAAALSSLLPAIPASHGADCQCRACGDTHYAKLLERTDYQRRELARLQAEVSELRSQLIRSEYARLTAEMTLAIMKGDREAWAKAMAERAL